jgi:hypothetical protein
LLLKSLAIALGLALTLTACGTKGPLEPPPSATAKPTSPAKADDGLGDIPAVGQKPAKIVKPIEPPKQPFLLDFLL